jgi:hypothetical protein
MRMTQAAPEPGQFQCRVTLESAVAGLDDAGPDDNVPDRLRLLDVRPVRLRPSPVFPATSNP